MGSIVLICRYIASDGIEQTTSLPQKHLRGCEAHYKQRQEIKASVESQINRRNQVMSFQGTGVYKGKNTYQEAAY